MQSPDSVVEERAVVAFEPTPSTSSEAPDVVVLGSSEDEEPTPVKRQRKNNGIGSKNRNKRPTEDHDDIQVVGVASKETKAIVESKEYYRLRSRAVDNRKG